MIFGFKQLQDITDWPEIVGVKNWVPRHSAYELAHKWHGRGVFPPRVQEVFAASPVPLFQQLRVACLYVEHPTFLDTFLAPSRTDIMAHCRTRDKEVVVVGIEGKAQETFDDPLADWLHNGDPTPRPTRESRLRFLSGMLGVDFPFPAESPLRYQLIHRTASVVREAALHGATAAVLLVHSFAEQPENNWTDFQAFLSHLQLIPPPRGVLSAPCLLGPGRDVPTYFVWVTDEPI